MRSSASASLTKNDESAEFRSVKSDLIKKFSSVADSPCHRNGGGEMTILDQTHGKNDDTDFPDELSRVLSGDKRSTSSIQSDEVKNTSLPDEGGRGFVEVSGSSNHVAASTVARLGRQGKMADEISPTRTGDSTTSRRQNSRMRREECTERPTRNHIDSQRSLSEKTLEPNGNSDGKNRENTPKGKSKKLLKRMSLRRLRFRKKKSQTELVDMTPSPEELKRKASILSGSLECLIDAVAQEESPPPLAGDFSRSISLCDLSVELDEPDTSYLSDTSISLASEVSTQSEQHTSSESLQQRLKEDEAMGVRFRTKHTSLQGLPNHQEQSHIHGLPLQNKKFEHRLSLKGISEEKVTQTLRRPHHARNKSDTSMLPTFQHSYMYTIASPKHNQTSAQTILQSLHDHIKSMPNVFRRDRANKPVVTELRVSQMTPPTDPIDSLIQYQFQSLRCCAGVQGHPDIRKIILEGTHNTEAQNYQLSFEREPN